MVNKELRVLPGYTVKADKETGIVDAYVSIMGIVDDSWMNDIIEPGAFKKTLAERGPAGSNRIRVLWQHNVREVIGRPLEMAEHPREQLPDKIRSKFPSASGGLFTRTQLVMDVSRAREAFALYESGAMEEWSIGFDTIDSWKEELEKVTYRHLRELRLWEYSPVTWGANPATMTVSVKSDEELKAVSVHGAGRARANGLISAGKVNRESPWSFSTEDDNGLLGDPPDWTNYGRHHLGFDSGVERESKAYWKYPFAKKSSGEIKLYRSALIAIRSRSAANGHGGVFDVAGRLINRVDGKADDREFEMLMDEVVDQHPEYTDIELLQAIEMRLQKSAEPEPKPLTVTKNEAARLLRIQGFELRVKMKGVVS
jgi:HK97 family phage prohead protease